MESLARLLVRRGVAWAVVVVSLVVCGVAAIYALRVERDDDLLAFLPADNREVATFRAINDRFGGLDVGIIAIATDNPFDGAFLEKLDALTRRLNDEPDIGFALSLSNTEDFVADPQQGGIRADYLVRPIPETAEASEALRAKVMSRDHVVGQLIAADASAVIIYAFLSPQANPRLAANEVRRIVGEALPGHDIYWGGAPFISTYIYDTTLEDMTRLIPWAIAVIVLLIVLSFRDVVGAALALLSTGMGIAVAHGLMGAFGVDANIVLSSMPVILFAVGSAYAIHVLVCYYALRQGRDVEEALVAALREIGPTVVAAGLTTVAGLLSFLMMDIRPMREFGLFTGLGILATLILSLTFVPAVVRLSNLGARHFGQSVFASVLDEVVTFAQRRRVVVLLVLGAVAAGGAAMAGRVEARMENAAFFAADSPPARAERFLQEEFGGSQFIQVEVAGDMNDPAALRKLQYVADRMALMPHVSAVTHVGGVVSLVNEAFSGERRIPLTSEQVRVVYRFLQGRPAVEQLVDGDKQRALLMVKIDSDAYDDVNQALAEIEAFTSAPPETVEGAEAVATHIATLLDLPADKVAALSRFLHGMLGSKDEIAHFGVHLVDRARVREQLVTYLKSDESLLDDDQKAQAVVLAGAIVDLGDSRDGTALEAAVAEALPHRPSEACLADAAQDSCAEARAEHGELVADVARSIATPLAELWRKSAGAAVADKLIADFALEVSDSERIAVRHALLDTPLGAQAYAAPLAFVVSGTPVLYRGLSQSVTQNQLESLAMALGLVLAIMIALFRSLIGGLIAAAPTVLTLLVVYGFMGARGMHLDIGTSMLASIIIGAGVDYAVHLMAAWKGATPEKAAHHAARQAGPAIWINALMVAAGFFVLTRGDARPLQNVGGLTSAAMLTAAIATFVAIPALARKLVPRTKASINPPR